MLFSITSFIKEEGDSNTLPPRLKHETSGDTGWGMRLAAARREEQSEVRRGEGVPGLYFPAPGLLPRASSQPPASHQLKPPSAAYLLG